MCKNIRPNTIWREETAEKQIQQNKGSQKADIIDYFRKWNVHVQRSWSKSKPKLNMKQIAMVKLISSLINPVRHEPMKSSYSSSMFHVK